MGLRALLIYKQKLALINYKTHIRNKQNQIKSQKLSKEIITIVKLVLSPLT